MKNGLKYSYVFICSAIIAITSLMIAADAQGYYVQYGHYVYATGSDGIPIMDNNTLNSQTSVFGNYTKYGNADVGNYATVDYYANLATGSIGSYAYSYGEKVGYTGYTATGRVDVIAFGDTLHFEVPAGTYADGISVNLSGTI